MLQLVSSCSRFYQDLWRTRNYYCILKDQPEGKREWTNEVLPELEMEIEQLQTHLTTLRELATSSRDSEIKRELSDAIGPFLRDVNAAGQLAREPERRYQLLHALLKEPEEREMLEWITENPQQKLPDRKKGGNTWSWWVSKRLAGECGLVTESVWGWELTERDEAVHQALQAVLDVPAVQQRQRSEGIDAETAALRVLS